MIEFNDNKPIYRQIVEYAFNCIINKQWKGDHMIPSVRELTTVLSVNNRTVLRALDELQDLGIIIPKRGMGFMLAADAADKVTIARRRVFFETTMPSVIDEMRLLGISPDEVVTMIRDTYSSNL